MGKKSREKRERKKSKAAAAPTLLLPDVHTFQGQTTRNIEADNGFQERLQTTRDVLRRYRRVDVAVALSVSDLWPANVGSVVKHIFAFEQLLGMGPTGPEDSTIATYEEFSSFAQALYAAWPEFPMLEDFIPEADWGQIRVRLGSKFVPMYYGSNIERTSDFVEAFRITYADSPQAQDQMDLAVAAQAHIIETIPELAAAPIPELERGHVEVPPEAFWTICRAALLGIGQGVASWRERTDSALETSFASFKAAETSTAFENAVMDGTALPYLAVVDNGQWIPLSVRNGPGVVIDHWAAKRSIGIGPETHRMLARFVAERFRGTYMGPFIPVVGGSAHSELTVSCVAPTDSLLYLICACDRASTERVSRAAKTLYAKLRRGIGLRFRLVDGRELEFSQQGTEGPGADEVRVVIVLTQSSTAMGAIAVPERPARLLPLADFITILDSLEDLDELEDFWRYYDGQRATLSPFSTGPADLFASFKDSHGVLVDGANAPDWIALDPHWGTSWRFKELRSFWELAPRQFPDGSCGWKLEKGTEGVVELQSRHHKAVAYSTTVGSCTVQSQLVIKPGMEVKEARMVDMFAQLLADSLHRCAEPLADLPLFGLPQVVLKCEAETLGTIGEGPPESLDKFPAVVVSATRGRASDESFYLKLEVRAILAGLNAAVDGSFEIRCLLETLVVCHSAAGFELPAGLAERLKVRAAEPARYHLNISKRYVDVPDYVEPIVSTPTQYKLARKQLAIAVKELGLEPGRYELEEAKLRIDPASQRLRWHLESRLASLDKHQMLQACIEQNDALLVAERMKIQRARQSLSHAVEYDRFKVVEEARKELGTASRHYRYLLEKVVSSPSSGTGPVDDGVLRELVALVDWYMVLTGASDVLHNQVDVGGVGIDDSYIPDVFYLGKSDDREVDYIREYSKSRLGISIKELDAVEGASKELLSSVEVRNAFLKDLGFELQHLLASLVALSQAQACGLGPDLALSYSATPERIAQVLVETVIGLDEVKAKEIVAFLTLSGAGVLRLPGRDVDEPDVPYWEHKKRVQRYTIRPLVTDGDELRWGAEASSRALNIWMSSVRDGYLPADFDWPNVVPVVREIKKGIEKRLELRSEEIFRRHTKHVARGIDFFKRFPREGFEDVGDFDVLAYWPDANVVVAVECKYNQPPHTVKDSRRLRDTIFGDSEEDRSGQLNRISRRRQFLAKHRARMLELLKWPATEKEDSQYIELYVGREVYYWMVHPPYPVPTQFVRVDMLDSWIKDQILG